MGNIIVKLLYFGPVVQEEMPFKENVYAQHRTDDGCHTTDTGRRPSTIVHPEPLAQLR